MRNLGMTAFGTSLAIALAIVFAPVGTTPTALAGCGSCGGHAHGKETANIIETARKAGSFKTLLAALEAAGLETVLAGEGPFTVFAPTDEAFAKLPPGTVEGLLKDKQKLTRVLTYHVVKGEVPAEKVLTLSSAETLNGQSVAIDTSNGVKIDGARVVKADVRASNGIIHVVDSVLIPSTRTASLY